MSYSTLVSALIDPSPTSHAAYLPIPQDTTPLLPDPKPVRPLNLGRTQQLPHTITQYRTHIDPNRVREGRVQPYATVRPPRDRPAVPISFQVFSHDIGFSAASYAYAYDWAIHPDSCAIVNPQGITSGNVIDRGYMVQVYYLHEDCYTHIILKVSDANGYHVIEFSHEVDFRPNCFEHGVYALLRRYFWANLRICESRFFSFRHTAKTLDH